MGPVHQGGRAERAGREDRMGQVKAKSNRDRDKRYNGRYRGRAEREKADIERGRESMLCGICTLY